MELGCYVECGGWVDFSSRSPLVKSVGDTKKRDDLFNPLVISQAWLNMEALRTSVSRWFDISLGVGLDSHSVL